MKPKLLFSLTFLFFILFLARGGWLPTDMRLDTGDPPGAGISYSVDIIESEIISDILPSPILTMKKDKYDLIDYDVILDSLDYNFIPDKIVKLSKQQYFRNIYQTQ